MENLKVKIQNKLNTIANDGKTITNISVNNLTFTPDTEDEGFTNYGICKQLPIYCIAKEVSKELDNKVRKLLHHLKFMKYTEFIKYPLISYFSSIIEDTYYLNSLKLIDKYDKLILSPFFQRSLNTDISIIPMINSLTLLKDEFHKDVKDDEEYIDFNKSRQHYYDLDAYLPIINIDTIPYMENAYAKVKLSHGVELLSLTSSTTEWLTILIYSNIADYIIENGDRENLKLFKGIEMTSEIRLLINLSEINTKGNDELCQN